MPDLDSMANGGVESSAESTEAEELQPTTSCRRFPVVLGLRRWRRIKRERQREGHTPATLAGGATGQVDECHAAPQLHKRRLPHPANARKVKHFEAAPAEDESSTASVESRFIPQPPKKLDRGLGGSQHAARSRADRLRVRAGAENSRSTVESELRSSSATKASHLVGRLARSSAVSDGDVDDTLEEASVRDGQDRGPHSISGADPYAESVLLLQRTQKALENEIEKIVAVGKVPSDEFDIYDDEGSSSVHLEEPIEEESETLKRLESRLEEASALIKEKDSTILELGALRRKQPGKTAIESAMLLLSQSDLDKLYQEKAEAEIQCLILTRAYQTLATLADDQMALYNAQKCLSEDYKQLGLKLRHAEYRALMLEKKAEKLQVQCKELSRSSEVLQMQSKASRASLFCFVQFVLLCIAIGTYLMQLVPSSIEVVPT